VGKTLTETLTHRQPCRSFRTAGSAAGSGVEYCVHRLDADHLRDNVALRSVKFMTTTTAHRPILALLTPTCALWQLSWSVPGAEWGLNLTLDN